MYDVVPGALQRLREADIISLAGLTVASLGQEYVRIGAVHSTKRQGARLSGIVDVPDTFSKQVTILPNGAKKTGRADTSPGHYAVEVEIGELHSWSINCTCLLHSAPSPTTCTHAAALLYQWLAHPVTFTSSSPPSLASQVPSTSPPKYVGTAPKAPMAVSRQLRDAQPAYDISEILAQSGLSELRGIAREYDIATIGLSKQQLVEAIIEILREPVAVRRIVGTLEKPQRQLLAAFTLAGNSMNDDDLRGLFERFSLGSPNQLQSMLLALQSKGLIVRTNLNSSMQPRSALSGPGLDVNWHVPLEVRSALHVTLPITPFDVDAVADDDTAVPHIQEVEQYTLLADLLLVARALDGHLMVGIPLAGYLPPRQDSLSGGQVTQRFHHKSGAGRPSRVMVGIAPPGEDEAPLAGIPPGGQVNLPPRRDSLGTASADGSMAIPPPAGMPSASLLESLQAIVPRSLSFLRFAIRLLRMADILFIEDATSSRLRVLPNAAQLLLGPIRTEIAHELFTHWLDQSTYEELFDLQEDGLRLRCRTTPLNQPALRPGELETENSEARQTLIALLAQAPLHQWINFSAFARFVYRLNPAFLQRRQRLFSSPHWWIEQEVGHPLQPMQLNDWLRAEGRYLAQLLQGPLHWWGATDVALSSDGRLLAFRLTSVAGALLSGMTLDEPIRKAPEQVDSPAIDVSNAGDLLVPCIAANWATIELIEQFAEVAGVYAHQLCYRLTPQALSEAFSRGKSPTPLLQLLRAAATKPMPSTGDRPLHTMLAQLERRIASYGHVRLYTDVTLLEVAEAPVMRELSATTSVDEQVVRTLHPTLRILKKQGAESLVEELKRRGQVPLLHDEE